MKVKFLVMFLVLCFCATSVFGSKAYETETVFDGTVIAAGTSENSNYKRIGEFDGPMAVQVTVTGTGTITLDYLLSADNISYINPATAPDIATGLTAGSYYISFEPGFAAFIKIRATETGAANPATVTVTFIAQREY